MPRTAVSALALTLAVANPSAQDRATLVRIGVPEPNNLQYLTLWVAQGAGYFAAEGLAVEVVAAPVPNQGAQALADGRVDLALLPPPLYLGLIAQERPIVLFANLLANDPINLVVRRDAAARLAASSAPLAERVRSLRGLRIGVAPEPPRRLRLLMNSAGLDPDRDIHVVIVPGEKQIDAFEKGLVDALYTHTPYLEDAVVRLGGVLYINQSAGEVDALRGGQIHSLAATRAYADAHPATIAAVTRAIARAERLIAADPPATTKALLQAGISSPTPQHLARIVAIYRPAVPPTPAVSAEAIQRNTRLYPARPAMPDFSRLRASDYVLTPAP